MQNIIYLEIQKPLKSETPRKERSFLNKANCWKSAIWNFDRIQSTSLFYLHIVRSQRCFINWDHRIWSYETCSEGLKMIREHIMPGPPKTTRKTYFSDGFFTGFHGQNTSDLQVSNSQTCSKTCETWSFRIALRVSTSFLRVRTGFLYRSHTMNTMKIDMTDRWGCFLVSWHHVL